MGVDQLVDQAWTSPWTTLWTRPWTRLWTRLWTTVATVVRRDEPGAGPRSPWTKTRSWTMRRTSEHGAFLNVPRVNVPAAERRTVPAQRCSCNTRCSGTSVSVCRTSVLNGAGTDQPRSDRARSWTASFPDHGPTPGGSDMLLNQT